MIYFRRSAIDHQIRFDDHDFQSSSIVDIIYKNRPLKTVPLLGFLEVFSTLVFWAGRQFHAKAIFA